MPPEATEEGLAESVQEAADGVPPPPPPPNIGGVIIGVGVGGNGTIGETPQHGGPTRNASAKLGATR